VIKKNNASVRCDCSRHGREVKLEAFMRNSNRPTACSLGAEMINREGMLADHNRFSDAEEHTHDHLNQLVRPVANNEARAIDLQFFRQPPLQVKRVSVRIKVKMREGSGNRCNCLRRRTERVLVRGNLDRIMNPVFAFKLFYRLSWLIRREGAN